MSSALTDSGIFLFINEKKNRNDSQSAAANREIIRSTSTKRKADSTEMFNTKTQY